MKRGWIFYTVLLVLFWGVWGAFSGLPTKMYGYPDQMVYSIWAFTMLVPCYFSMRGQPFDRRFIAAVYGLLIGLIGAAGQLVLFQALAGGPAYLIFPIISLSPAITVLLAFVLLREKVAPLGWLGVIMALVAIVLFSIPQKVHGAFHVGAWLLLAMITMLCWGVQAFLMKRAAVSKINDSTIFAYMTLSGLLLVPVALLGMHGSAFDYAWKAPLMTTATQLLNAVGALFLVMALSRGKAVIVAPCTNALAPILTIILSLLIYREFPSLASGLGMVLALVGSTLMVYSEEKAPATAEALG